MAGTHARYSPSGAHGWMRCADWASNPAGSKDADEGTAAHELAAMALTAGSPAMAYLGRIIEVESGREFEVTHEMIEAVQSYLDYVTSIPGERMVEQRLSISHLTGECDAAGTSDCVILAGGELIVIDLKFGANPNNKVDAVDNEQGVIYLLAALDTFGLVQDFSRARFVIHQPRCNHVSEWDMSIEDLEAYRPLIKPAATINPGAKQCKWCAKKATCPTLAERVQNEIEADFQVIPAVMHDPATASDASLSDKMRAVDLIEDWCKAVRAEVERRLLAGVPVPGYKIVEGRRGARRWSNEKDVEALLKSMRLKQDQMYDFTLISPTTAEKLHKSGVLGPRQWPQLQDLITQAEGKPSVAPESDKRPALVMTAVADEFESLV